MENIILIDSDLQEAQDFVIGLQEESGKEWKVIVCNSNKPRTNRLYNYLRYFKYFMFPFQIFLKRKIYNDIIAWQQFYGVIFSFYCRLFKVKKSNRLCIMTFIYKEKSGLLGKIYEKFVDFALCNGEYIDAITCTAKTEMKYYSDKFNIPFEKFTFVPWGILDYAKESEYDFKPIAFEEGFVFSPGRSNRDWDFVIKSLKNETYRTLIACDDLKKETIGNVVIDNTIDMDASLKLFEKCFCVLVSIDNPYISSGQTVLIQAMNYGKPVIITKSPGLSDDYIEDHVNGIVIEKTVENLQAAIMELKNDTDLYMRLSHNGRKEYEKKYSKYSLGKNVGAAFAIR